MLKRTFVRFLIAGCALAALTSCGDSKSGGTGQLATVFATATAPGAPLDVDVATWVDAATRAPAQPCLSTSVPTFLPTDATYVVTSTPYAVPNTGQSSTITPSVLEVTKIIVTMTPQNTNTPALPLVFQTQYPSSGQRIAPGGSSSITIRIAPNNLKEYLIGLPLPKSLGCTGLTFSYRATVSFELVEVTTNRVSTVTAPGFLEVNFSDYID